MKLMAALPSAFPDTGVGGWGLLLGPHLWGEWSSEHSRVAKEF